MIFFIISKVYQVIFFISVDLFFPYFPMMAKRTRSSVASIEYVLNDFINSFLNILKMKLAHTPTSKSLSSNLQADSPKALSFSHLFMIFIHNTYRRPRCASSHIFTLRLSYPIPLRIFQLLTIHWPELRSSHACCVEDSIRASQ